MQRFTLFCRTLLVLGFVAPGLTKVFGTPFANPAPPGTPLDQMPVMLAFFEAFHATGAYYTFVGAAQAGAALLLLSRRTALIGAVLYFPVIANISVLTVATNFGPLLGTQLATVLMALACLWLLAWDAHRLAPIFSQEMRSVPGRAQEPAIGQMLVPRPGTGAPHAARLLLRGAWLLGFAGAMAVLLAARGPSGLAVVLRPMLLPSFYAALSAVPLAAAGWALWWWQTRRASEETAPA